MDYLKISIITPSYNMGQYIEQCIQSILFQNYTNYEHIVIDGGSLDQTTSILKKYKEHVKWISEKDNGISDAFNKGLRIATGDIIGWCSADDYYLPGTFKYVNKIMLGDSSIDILYGDYREVDAQGYSQCIRREINFDLFILKYLHINYIAPPATFWKKTIHESGIMFDEKYDYSMDYDFWIKVAREGYRFKHIPVLLTDFRKHSNAKSANYRQKNEHESIVGRYNQIHNNLPVWINKSMRYIFMLIARLKRTIIRTIRGHYFEQWWRG
jgi:glycosyltransferase involved in cell wall biosynthesis